MRLAGATLLKAQVTPQTDWLFLRATDASGVTGWGECSLDGKTGRVRAAADAVLPDLIGRDFAPEALIDRLPMADLPHAALSSALCQASWDIRAQRTGEPLFKALGGPETAEIGLYANINRRSHDRRPEGMAVSARRARAAGFSAIKIAPFDEVTPDQSDAEAGRAMSPGLDRIAAVRDALGTGARLMIDCHWRFTPVSAAAMIRAAAAQSPWWIECPLPETPDNMHDIRTLRRIANHLGMRLAGLEMEVRAEGFRPWLAAGAYDVMMPDVKYAGGPQEMLRIAAELAGAGVAFSPHNPTGPICHAHSLHVCAAVPGADLLEHQFDETVHFAGIVTPGLPASAQGVATLDDRPGLGLALDGASFEFETLCATSERVS